MQFASTDRNRGAHLLAQVRISGVRSRSSARSAASSDCATTVARVAKPPRQLPLRTAVAWWLVLALFCWLIVALSVGFLIHLFG